MNKVLAINTSGDLTYCTVPPELRGRGRCNHIAHQNPDETVDQFIERVNESKQAITDEVEKNLGEEISDDEVQELSSRIDKIAGVHLTKDNFNEVMNGLSPDQLAEITKIGFEAAPMFSLPISDEDLENESIKTQIYFSKLPEYGIAGNAASLAHMFEKVGEAPYNNGETIDIPNSYKHGLTPHEYFQKQFSARAAMIAKTVSVAKPGHAIYINQMVTIDRDGEI